MARAPNTKAETQWLEALVDKAALEAGNEIRRHVDARPGDRPHILTYVIKLDPPFTPVNPFTLAIYSSFEAWLKDARQNRQRATNLQSQVAAHDPTRILASIIIIAAEQVHYTETYLSYPDPKQ